MPICNISPPRYYKLSEYFKRLSAGKRVHKISVDAGFSCPNRDGKLSTDGCIYCDNAGFSLNSRIPSRPVHLQIEEGIKNLRKRFKAEKFIVYFQAYTNTYADIEVLKKRYSVIRDFNEVIGLAIATRPDCINTQILDLIDAYTSDYEVWIEYGLQSIHQKTLEFINRQHTYADFLKAVELTRQRKNIKICAHLIIGLPFETKKMLLETAKEMGRLKLEGIKIHPLHIIKGTRLEELFRQGLYSPLEVDAYLDLLSGFLECLWSGTVIQRLSADCPQDLLVAPRWILDKDMVLQKIEEKLEAENIFQGRLFK